MILTLLDDLIVILETECRLLTQVDVDGPALEKVTSDKQRMLQALGHAKADADAKFIDDATRERTRERARTAVRLNRRNGRMLAVRMSGNRRILDYLNAKAGRGLYASAMRSRPDQIRGALKRPIASA